MIAFFKQPDDFTPMPLPMNMPEFEAWSARIIKKAKLPTKNFDSQRFALASMILQSSPTEFLRPDIYYINLLKKAASDQCALQVMEDLREKKSNQASEAPTILEPTNDKEVVN